MRKIFGILLVLALVLSFSIVATTPVAAQPAEVWVDDDFHSGTAGWGSTHFSTILDGINAVVAGGTVHVAAGTYTNDIWDSSLGIPAGYRITKSVTLLGAKSGVDPDGSTDRGGESILVRTNGVPYSLYSSDIIIDGFTFTSGGGSGGGRIVVSENGDGAIIRNCIIKDISGTDPHGIYIYAGAEGVLVEKNTLSNTVWEAIRCDGEAEISNNTVKNIPSQKGISVGASGHAEIKGNTINNTFYEGIQAAGVATITGNHISGCYKGVQVRDSAGGSTISGNIISNTTWEGIEVLVPSTVSGNDISACYKGIHITSSAAGSTISGNIISSTTWEGIQAWAPSTIAGNDISGCGLGIQIRNHATGTTIDSNTIHNNTYYGIEIPNHGGSEPHVTGASITNNSLIGNGYPGIRVGGAAGGSGIVVHFNSFDGNGYYGVESTSSQVDARWNWWGDDSGPSGVGPGTGDAVSANVLYDPWIKKTTSTATGTGTASFTPSHGAIVELAATVPPSLPSVSFPHGMFSFKITGLSTGQTVTVTIELPDPIPVGTVWWKHDNGRWYSLPNLNDNGDNIMVIQLKDGGAGDLDSVAGQITDPGGPGNPMTVGWETSPVGKASVMVPWIALLAAIVAGTGLLVWRRRRAQS